MMKFITHKCEYGIFGHEVGAQGTPHLQGYMSFVNPRHWSALAKLFPRLWIAPARKSAIICRRYCTKDGAFWEAGAIPPGQGKRSDLSDAVEYIRQGATFDMICDAWPDLAARVPDFLQSRIARTALLQIASVPLVLFPWQSAILDHIHPVRCTDDCQCLTQSCWSNPIQSREIMWIWSERSSTGKSAFLDYLFRRFPGQVFKSPNAKTADFVSMFNGERIVCYNLPREQPGQHDSLGASLQFLERLSDRGVMSGGKYRGRSIVIDHIHIIVCSNVPPPVEQLPLRLVDILAYTPTDPNFVGLSMMTYSWRY